jgi:DNA-binding transcriptional MocR family regulator
MADSRLSSRALVQLLGEWRDSAPAYRGLADTVRMLCLDRRIAPGTALPAERDLAARLGLSRTTVAAAYRDLRASGHIESLRGSGSVVRAVGPLADIPEPGDTDTIDLHRASPAAWPGLSELFVQAAADAARWVGRSGYDLVGALRLREAIADRYTARGLPTVPDQIIVTTGAQSAISLVSDVVVRRGDRVAIETPTYPHAADVLREAGARLVAIPVDAEFGWDLERADHVLRRAAPSLAYLMPDFQNPTGATMDSSTRRTLAEAAADSGVLVLADETTADLDIDRPFASQPFGVDLDPAVQRNIVTIGSLGKTVWGGLRIGWIRADLDLVPRLIAARPRRELGTPELEQQVAILAFDRLPEVLVQRAHLLRTGRDTLVRALGQALPEWSVPTVHGGVSLWVGLGAPVSSPLALAVRSRGLILSSGPRFGVDGGHERHMRVPFTAPPADLERAVEILADAWPEARDRGRPVTETVLAAVV